MWIDPAIPGRSLQLPISLRHPPGGASALRAKLVKLLMPVNRLTVLKPYPSQASSRLFSNLMLLWLPLDRSQNICFPGFLSHSGQAGTHQNALVAFPVAFLVVFLLAFLLELSPRSRRRFPLSACFLFSPFRRGTFRTPAGPRRISELAKGPGILFVAPPLGGRLAQPPEDV